MLSNKKVFETEWFVLSSLTLYEVNILFWGRIYWFVIEPQTLLCSKNIFGVWYVNLIHLFLLEVLYLHRYMDVHIYLFWKVILKTIFLVPNIVEFKYKKYSQASGELNIFRCLFSVSFSGVACTLVFVSSY